jgi:hypothetical protein
MFFGVTIPSRPLARSITAAFITTVALGTPACGSANPHAGRTASTANERPTSASRLRACGVPRLQTGTRPPKSTVLSDRTAACLVNLSRFEPRPQNTKANHRVPSTAQLAAFRRVNRNPYKSRITGHYVGTTDEIIQWAAWKWGVSADLLRAVAVYESWWKQSIIGDGGTSYGIMQLKKTFNPGFWPLVQRSTAFDVDAYAATLRYYYDGHATWLHHGYRAGDIWGSVGAYFKAQWHTPPADHYARGVRTHMLAQTWRGTHF